MKKSFKRKSAIFLSDFFSPLLTFGLGFEVLLTRLLKQGFLDAGQKLILSFLLIYLPLIFFFISLRQGKFDFDLTKKKERFQFFVFVLACGFSGLNFAYYFSAYVFRLLLVLTFTGLAFVVITFWSKASLHVGCLTSFYLVTNLFSSWQYFYLFPLIPLVAWSRILLKNHTLKQTIEGFLIPLIVIPSGFYFLKII